MLPARSIETLNDLAARFPVGTRLDVRYMGHCTVIDAAVFRAEMNAPDARYAQDAGVRMLPAHSAYFERGPAFFPDGHGVEKDAARIAVRTDYVQAARGVPVSDVTKRTDVSQPGDAAPKPPEPILVAKLALVEAYGGLYLAYNVRKVGAVYEADKQTLVKSGARKVGAVYEAERNVEPQWFNGGQFGSGAKITPLPTDVPGTTLLGGAEREDARCAGYEQGKREGYERGGYERGKRTGRRIGRYQAMRTLSKLVEAEVERDAED